MHEANAQEPLAILYKQHFICPTNFNRSDGHKHIKSKQKAIRKFLF